MARVNPKYSILREARIGEGRTVVFVTGRVVFDAHGHVTVTGTMDPRCTSA